MKSRLSVAAITIAALFLAMTVACSDSDYHKCADANAKIASALGAITQTTIELTNSGEVDVLTAAAILGEVDHAVVVNEQFRDRLRQTKSIKPGDRAAVLAWISDIGSSLDRLNQTGVLHIKNPDTQAKFSTAIAAARAAAAVVSSVVQSSEVNGGSKARSNFATRTDGFERRREIGGGAESAVGNDGRSASRLGSSQRLGHARADLEVPGRASGDTIVTIAFESVRCGGSPSTERQWRTGRCRIRT